MQTATRATARAIFAGAFAQNKTRSMLSVLAIALGVALGYAVQLITQSAQDELALGVRTLSGDADLQVRGPRGGFDERLYPELSRLPEVAVASPVVEIDAKLADRDDVLKIIGIDALRAAAVQPGLIAEAGDRLDLFRPNVLFLSPAAAHWLDLAAGAPISFQVALRDATLTVAGLAPAGEQQRFAVMDIAGAQSNFDRLGLITRLDLRLQPGVALAGFRDRLQQRLPAGIVVERPEASLAASASVSRSYRVNMNVLALVALFTGGLLVFSTQALAVVRRRAHFALLRVLGVTRRGLVGSLLAEGALIGAVGSALGLVAGYALAQAAVRVIGPDLGSGYFRGVAPTLVAAPLALALCFCLGVAAALLGSVLPALEAARASPAQALKAGDEERRLSESVRSSRSCPRWPDCRCSVISRLRSC
jgi:putative ABC transport system permease protein